MIALCVLSVYYIHMGFKTISVSDEVYRRLKKAKDREGVSFTGLLEKVSLPGGQRKVTAQEFLDRLGATLKKHPLPKDAFEVWERSQREDRPPELST
jgi:predicted CopG family antitoxin